MKSLSAILIFAGAISLSACSNKDNAATNVITVPSVDSVTKGSHIKMFLSATDSLYLTDLAVKTLPVETLTASDFYNPTDSTYSLRILVNDSKMKTVALNLSAKNSGMDPLATTYYVTSNSSTFTDYRTGENKTYAVQVGSYVTITQATNPIQGSMNLTLRYNMDSSKVLTGTFYIYQ